MDRNFIATRWRKNPRHWPSWVQNCQIFHKVVI